MALDSYTPRTRERFVLENPRERDTQLPRVNRRARLVHTVKEHHLLERRQWIEDSDFACCKLRVCVSLADERPQRFHKTLGETFYRAAPVGSGAINPLAL